VSAWPKPLVAVDIVAVTVLDMDLKILLVLRDEPPLGSALPGGFVRCGDAIKDQGEDLEAAARRELAEETALGALASEGVVALEQVGVFGAPSRDPRARVISVAYLAAVRPELAAFVRAGGDARAVSWQPVSSLAQVPLAFDHAAIVQRALAALRRDVLTPRIARALVPDPFTILELRAAVDAVHGARSDAGNFRRSFLRLVDDGIVKPAPGRRVTGRRPAQVWSFTSV
jgi:8-oxo-dGTP diphosphatase